MSGAVMNSMQRVLTTLGQREPDRVPLFLMTSLQGARELGLSIADYFARADSEMCLIVQIESTHGLAALDEILAVDGVDAVFIGPSDLAASMGHLGQPGHPEVKTAVETAIGQIAAAGKAAGVFSADPATAGAYQAIGARFLLVGVDTLLLRNAAVALADRFKPAAGAASGAAY